MNQTEIEETLKQIDDFLKSEDKFIDDNPYSMFYRRDKVKPKNEFIEKLQQQSDEGYKKYQEERNKLIEQRYEKIINEIFTSVKNGRYFLMSSNDIDLTLSENKKIRNKLKGNGFTVYNIWLSSLFMPLICLILAGATFTHESHSVIHVLFFAIALILSFLTLGLIFTGGILYISWRKKWFIT